MSLAFIVRTDLAPTIDAALTLLFRKMKEAGMQPPADAVELQQWAQVVLQGFSLAYEAIPLHDPPVAKPLLSLPDVAAELGCSLSKVKKLVVTGVIPVVDFAGRRRVLRTDLNAYLAGLGPVPFRSRITTKEA